MKTKTTVFLGLALIFGLVSACVWMVDAEPQNFDGVSTSFSVVINYVDGTTETYTTPSLSLLPYSLTDSSGKEWELLEIYLNAKLGTSGTVSSWAFVGTQQVEWYKTPETVPRESSTMNINDAGSTWADGETKTLSYVAVHYSQIESAIAKHGTGDWTFNINAQVTMDVTFESGASDIAKAVAPAITVPFTYSGDGITSFSLIIQNTMTPLSLGEEMLVSNGLPIWTIHALFPLLTVVCSVLTIYFYKTED